MCIRDRSRFRRAAVPSSALRALRALIAPASTAAQNQRPKNLQKECCTNKWIVNMATVDQSKTVERNQKLLNEKQAAEHLAVSPGTLSVWRSTGRYALPFVKVGRTVRYRLSDLDAWLDARARNTGATV